MELEPAVVLLHCSGSSAAQWRSLAGKLAGRYRVITPDLIGYGASTPWAGRAEFCLAQEAAAIRSILGALDEPAHLVGHSYGGAVALHIARTRPELLRSLTLIEPSAFHLLRGGDEFDAAALREISEVASYARTMLASGDYMPAFGHFVDYWSGPGTWAAMPADKRAAFAPQLTKIVLDFQALLNEPAEIEHVKDIDLPTLLLQGGCTTLPSRCVVKRLCDALPAAQLRVVQGAGHMLPVTHRDAVNGVIAEFLDSISTRDAPASGCSSHPKPRSSTGRERSAGGVGRRSRAHALIASEPGPSPQARWPHAAQTDFMNSAVLMVAVCTAMVAMAFGAVGTVAVFLQPIAAEFAWPRADVAAAYSVATVATGLGGIAMGHFADRLPVRRVALFGALVPGMAFMLLSDLHGTLALYVLHAVMGLVGIGAIMAPLNRLASLWLARNPGLAIGIVSAGGAAGQGLVPYFARYLIVTEGWRQAYWILGLLFIAVMVPLALLLRDAPVAGNARPGAGGGPSAVRLLALLSLAALLCCVCMGTPLVHVVTLGSDRGLGGREAAGLLAVMMVAGMAGRIGFGRLSDRFGSLQTYIAASAGQTALAFLFPYAASGAQLYVLSALFGLVFSGAMTSFLSCAREYAPAGKTGLSLGVVMFFGWTGMALGAWQGGLFYDLCGDYFVSFANASAAGVANLLVLALLLLYVLRAGARRLKNVSVSTRRHPCFARP